VIATRQTFAAGEAWAWYGPVRDRQRRLEGLFLEGSPESRTRRRGPTRLDHRGHRGVRRSWRRSRLASRTSSRSATASAVSGRTGTRAWPERRAAHPSGCSMPSWISSRTEALPPLIPATVPRRRDLPPLPPPRRL